MAGMNPTRRRRLVVVGAHLVAGALALVAAALLELPAWAAGAGVVLVALHLLAVLAVGGAAGTVLSFVPPLLAVALVLTGVSGGACDPCTGGWSGVPFAVAALLGFVFAVDLVAGPLWGTWRRR